MPPSEAFSVTPAAAGDVRRGAGNRSERMSVSGFDESERVIAASLKSASPASREQIRGLLLNLDGVLQQRINSLQPVAKEEQELRQTDTFAWQQARAERFFDPRSASKLRRTSTFGSLYSVTKKIEEQKKKQQANEDGEESRCEQYVDVNYAVKKMFRRIRAYNARQRKFVAVHPEAALNENDIGDAIENLSMSSYTTAATAETETVNQGADEGLEPAKMYFGATGVIDESIVEQYIEEEQAKNAVLREELLSILSGKARCLRAAPQSGAAVITDDFCREQGGLPVAHVMQCSSCREALCGFASEIQREVKEAASTVVTLQVALAVQGVEVSPTAASIIAPFRKSALANVELRWRVRWLHASLNAKRRQLLLYRTSFVQQSESAARQRRETSQRQNVTELQEQHKDAPTVRAAVGFFSLCEARCRSIQAASAHLQLLARAEGLCVAAESLRVAEEYYALGPSRQQTA